LFLYIFAEAKIYVQSSQYADSYVTAVYVPIIPKSKFNAWSCVIFARQYIGRDDIKGTAGDLKPTVTEPYVGGIVLLDEGKYGHIAVITDIASQSLSLIEANYKPGQITTRTIPTDYPRIIGYK